MSKPIFYDPERKRWKRLRLITDPLGLAITLVIVFFVYSMFRDETLNAFSLPESRRPLKSLKEHQKPPKRRNTHRKTLVAPSQVALNSGEGIRAAYYVPWDEGSYSSLKEVYPQIDLLFPEWLHVVTPDGRLQALAEGNKLFEVVQGSTVHSPDDKHPVMSFLKEEKAQTEVFPLVNNFDPTTNQWLTSIGDLLNNPAGRASLRRDMMTFLASDHYQGISLDFEEIPEKAQPGFQALVSELERDLHARGMKLYLNLPANDNDFDYRALAAHSDGIILMNYDQHVPGTGAGPVAAQDWYVQNLQLMLKLIPRQKIIAGIGNYGYDFLVPAQGKPLPAQVDTVSVQEAWLHAQESESPIMFDSDSMNPHYGYMDEQNRRHEVWYLDAVTALNEMRAARVLGINTFALWRLGAEDGSLWQVWDLPRASEAPEKLRSVPPGQDVDRESRGDVLRIEASPSWGWRNVTVDPISGLVTDENFSALPLPYQLNEYGWSKNKIAISFDDGPDPKWTPLILDVLRDKNAKATFFLIGGQAEKYPGLMQRIYREGHEIGNHTWSHPDVSNLSSTLMRLEINSTERLFQARLGVEPMFFRPPYSIDEEPDTAAQVEPLTLIQSMGYITIGSKIDPNDWRTTPHRTAGQIAQDVITQATELRPQCTQAPCGNIVLLHDGGGDRSQTARALPMIIDGLRAHGFEIVQVSELLGKQYSEVMVPLSANERWSAIVDRMGFLAYGWIYQGIVIVFFLGNILMTSRLLLVGGLAVYERLRSPRAAPFSAEELPSVAVLVPAFNEAQVIVNTVGAALASQYPADKLRVIVIAAIARLVTHFKNPRVGAVAGNAKVGNRVNLWTRWQALEYITSQNFERRALDALGAVTVVPGALGAWRTQAVRELGGFHLGTVAEDADLTMSLLQHGLRVEYEDRALAFTEAPINANGLMRQRFRWSFGILQAVWKHRSACKRKGLLGWVALPNIAVFQILLPVVSPLIDLMFLAGVIWYFIDKHNHPLTNN